MSELNWIETNIELRYKDGSTRRIKVIDGENLTDIVGKDCISLSIIDPPYGAYSHNNITPKGGISPTYNSPKGEEISEAGSREGALDPG